MMIDSDTDVHGMMKRLIDADQTVESVAKDLETSADYPGSTEKMVEELRKIRIRLRRVLMMVESSTRPRVLNREG